MNVPFESVEELYNATQEAKSLARVTCEGFEHFITESDLLGDRTAKGVLQALLMIDEKLTALERMSNHLYLEVSDS